MPKRMLVLQRLFTGSKQELDAQERGMILCEEYGYEPCVIPIDQAIVESWDDNRSRCGLASDMIGALSECDAALFMRSWKSCPACRLTHEACQVFGVPTFYEGEWTPWDELEDEDEEEEDEDDEKTNWVSLS